LVSVVAENRKPCPPTKKKTTSNQIKEKLELEFPMCSHWSTPPIAFSLRDPYEKYTWSVRAVTWDCRRVRSRTSVSHVLESQACKMRNQTPGPRGYTSGNGSSVHTELEIVKYPVMTRAQNIFKSWRRPAHVNMNARMSVRQARFRNTKWPNDVRNSVTEALFSW
jgi:hypothetical protein